MKLEDELNQIHVKCESHRCETAEIAKALAVMAPALLRIEANQERLSEAIHGNGKPGIKERVAVIESGFRRLWWAIGLSISTTIAIAGLILKAMS